MKVNETEKKAKGKSSVLVDVHEGSSGSTLNVYYTDGKDVSTYFDLYVPKGVKINMKRTKPTKVIKF